MMGSFGRVHLSGRLDVAVLNLCLVSCLPVLQPATHSPTSIIIYQLDDFVHLVHEVTLYFPVGVEFRAADSFWDVTVFEAELGEVFACEIYDGDVLLFFLGSFSLSSRHRQSVAEISVLAKQPQCFAWIVSRALQVGPLQTDWKIWKFHNSTII